MRHLYNTKTHVPGRSAAGFTLPELLVILGCLALFALTVIPAFAKASFKSDSLVCLTHYKQLVQAWQMYAYENEDRLPMSEHSGGGPGGAQAGYPTPWVLGVVSWGLDPDNTNVLFLTDNRYSALARYLAHDPLVFKCPADTYLSGQQKARRWTMRVRSVSCNVGIGWRSEESVQWPIDVYVNMYKFIRTTSDFIYPGPADTWIYLDEHPDSINSAGFINPRASEWLDIPATYHNGASSFAFADGHVESHRWMGSMSQPILRQVRYAYMPRIPVQAGDPDIKWINYRAGRLSEKTF
jgi:prepilin-type processing-associated H-X9-DG protein